MTIIDTNLKEMMFGVATPSLSKGNEMEEYCVAIDNSYAKASFTEIRTPNFSIMDGSVCSRDDLKIYSHTEENDMLWFCAALQGNVRYFDNRMSREGSWRSGQANLLSYSNIDTCSCFRKEEPVRMLDIMLSPEYIEKIATAYLSLLGDIFYRHKRRCFFKAFQENIPFCMSIKNALNDILNCKCVGNAAPMYLDAKILEILSLFLCQSEENCLNCDRYSPRDNDKFVCAKEIIEQEYLCPPSLHELALRVGTNECKLKSGFKTLFRTTVFGYLFDYRMDMAARYLSDTGKSVQEIGELVGYEYQSHFSTAFKRKFGVSPHEYRSHKKFR